MHKHAVRALQRNKVFVFARCEQTQKIKYPSQRSAAEKKRRDEAKKRIEKTSTKTVCVCVFFAVRSACSAFPFWFRAALCVSALIVELLFSLAVAPSLWRHFPLAVARPHYVSLHFSCLHLPTVLWPRRTATLVERTTPSIGRKKKYSRKTVAANYFLSHFISHYFSFALRFARREHLQLWAK